ncbi:MAG: iron ABC transporter permease [Prevotellaceae bacterium]|jgi:iron complex transport system permease protein|nr:iron ABC transporter permease [Prevotellaceae bacterium]
MFVRKRNFFLFTTLIISTLVFFAVDLAVGATAVSLSDIFRTLTGDDVGIAGKILLNFRLPKAAVAVLAGMSLSVSGLQMQTIFRNPLADPYVLGVSAGSGLGVALFIMGTSFLTSSSLLDFGVYPAAWLGSALVLIMILAVSTRIRDAMTVLILGVMFGGAASAAISILQYFSSESNLKIYMIWTMGSLGAVASDKLPIMILASLAGLILSIFSIKPLNVLLLGETYARSAGVNVRLARNVVFLGTGILTGTITAFCGPIAFVGIAVPHIARMIFRRADHKVLMPGVMLIGALMMLLCDIISQTVKPGTTLPINSITSLLGIPVIIFVIMKYRS